MSEAKTKITHTGNRARFLGYDITVSRRQETVKRKDGVVPRSQAYVVKLLVPRAVQLLCIGKRFIQKMYIDYSPQELEKKEEFSFARSKGLFRIFQSTV